MALTITDALNTWNDLGVFSYVIPFLLIFAVVFAILEKSKILGDNRPIMSIVAASIGLLSLQFDYVSTFFAIIFPKFGIGLSIFLVLLILIGFFSPKNSDLSGLKWIGYLTGIGVVLWSITSWNYWFGGSGFGFWFYEYFWAIIILGTVIGAIYLIAKEKNETKVQGATKG